jgi:hypothetical protein
MILRRAFLKRMALAAAACAFFDVPWPKVPITEETILYTPDDLSNLAALTRDIFLNDVLPAHQKYSPYYARVQDQS